MISLGDRLVLAWTEAVEPARLRTAALPLADAD
jgi:hypothetical protein